MFWAYKTITRVREALPPVTALMYRVMYHLEVESLSKGSRSNACKHTVIVALVRRTGGDWITAFEGAVHVAVAQKPAPVIYPACIRFVRELPNCDH